MTPTELLATAHRLTDEPDSGTAGLWSRAAAVLLRQALEGAVCEMWTRRAPRVVQVPWSTQFLCLREFISDTQLADEATSTWAALSVACHHRGYSVGPSAGDLRTWADTITRVVDAVATKGVH